MGFINASGYLLKSFGATIPSHRRSLWVHGDTPLQFDAARQLIHGIMAERPHVRLVLTSQRLRTLKFLRATFVDDQTLPAPRGVAPVLNRYLRRLQVRHILLLDGGRSFPPDALRLAASQQIPISAVNVGSPGAVDNVLLEAARQYPAIVRLCVYDESVAQQLHVIGVPPVSIATTGCLDLDVNRSALWSAASALRRLLNLREDTPVAAVTDLPREEEKLVFGAFEEARQARPDLRLIVEPRRESDLVRLRNDIQQRGWVAVVKSHQQSMPDQPWDILLAEFPGDLPALLPVTAAVIVGGTYSTGGTGAFVSATIAAGAKALVGPQQEFEDVPWQFLRASPLVRTVEAEDLATALVAAVQSSPTRIVVSGDGAPTPSQRTHAAISSMLPDSPELPNVAQDWKVPTLRDRGGRSRVWRMMAPALMKKRVDSWKELSTSLGNPRSVLCLGNGPSSEDPRVAGFQHDCLIRVNWRWKTRGFLTNPQIVFVGDPATVHRVHDTVFGIWNTPLEFGILLRHLITHGPMAMNYFTMDRISPIVRDHTWPARPTNGALMIAAGAALAPDRLIIAGIDLYLHPDGRYPGDLLSNNQYAAAHSRDTDLAIIRSSLAQYRGELVIISDLLRKALELSGEASSGGC
jgi:3-deoxy-D-manno-octulosonic-acid transferase